MGYGSTDGTIPTNGAWGYAPTVDLPADSSTHQVTLPLYPAGTYAAPVAMQNRVCLIYKDASSVYVAARSFHFAGFRFMGQYLRPTAKFRSVVGSAMPSVSFNTDISVINTPHINNWYGVFAVANASSTNAVLKMAPFFRVQSVAGSVITFGGAGEAQDYASAYTYDVPTPNNAVGVDVLVVSETINSVQNYYSGRLTTVTANTATTLTLASIGTIAAGDWVIVAPPGFTDYCYLSSLYNDGATRNFADSGSIVKTRSIQIPTGATLDGALSASGVQFIVAGIVPPLATGAVLEVTQSLSTASTGDFLYRMQIDATHDYHVTYQRKDNTITATYVEGGVICPFAYAGQRVIMTSGGALEGSATRQVQVRGWIEP